MLMCVTSTWYNRCEVTSMNKLEEILKWVDELPADQQMELLKILEKKMAIPLQNPHQIFDDWDNKGVDDAYAETR